MKNQKNRSGILRITLLLFLSQANLSFGQVVDVGSYVDEVIYHRDTTDLIFADSAKSILTKEDQKNFTGLEYFSVDTAYVVYASFKRKRFTRRFKMPTSTDRTPIYKSYGRLTFEINGEKQELTLYKNVKLSKQKAYKDYLFCPFKDLSNGALSYGGGRYLDFDKQELKKDSTIIDFNMSYNPYCAYNSRYSCPIPPIDNHLQVEILAGIRKWHD